MQKKLNNKLPKLKNFFLLVFCERSKKIVLQSKVRILNFKNTVQDSICRYKTFFKKNIWQFFKFYFFYSSIIYLLKTFLIIFSLKFSNNQVEIISWLKTIAFLTISIAFVSGSLLYYFNQRLKKLITELAILPTKKLIWGVQIQSFNTTLFALGFSLFLTIYFSFLCDLLKININPNNKNYAENYAEGATQIMIAIGTSLMAMAIFVFESIARKRRYFDKYFLLGITNIFNLVILFFIGLFLLIFHYFDTPFISHFVKNFIDIYIYCLILIALAVIRIYKTAICLLDRDNAKKIEEEIVFEYVKFFNSSEDKDKNTRNFFFYLEDYFSDTLNEMKNINLEVIKDSWDVIYKFYEIIFDKIKNEEIQYFDGSKIGVFLYRYTNNISLDFDLVSCSELIQKPTKIFKILIDKKIIIDKPKYLLSHPIQDYFYYFISLYEKGFEIKNSDKKLSKNEENFANNLIYKSWCLPEGLIKNFLAPNYKRDQQNQAFSSEQKIENSLFFKNYAKEFFIFYRELLKMCFDNDDFESFEIISKSLGKLLKCDYSNIEKNDENYREIQQYKLLNLYGLASWILEKTNIDRAEKNQRFIDNICNHIFDIIDREIDVLDNIANNLYEIELTKFIKLYLKAKKLDDNFDTDYLLGLDRWDRASRGEGAWMSEVSSWINNFFIYFCLARFDKFQISNNLTAELSNISKISNQGYIFNEIINNLDDLLKIYKPSNNNNNILKLLNKPIKDADNLINDLKNAINSIIGFIAKERVKDVMESKIDKNKIAKFKDEIKQFYQKSFSIKNILKQFGLYDLKAFNQHDNRFGINEALDKEYFIENSNIHLMGFDESCSNSMIAEENDNILNKAILKNPIIADKLIITNLNEFEKILELFGKDAILSEDAILILLNTGEHWFESELNKRTYYKNNFIAPRLRNTSESIPENAVGIYKFSQQKIPVYSIFSETKSGLLVLNKKKFGKLIQYTMNQNIKSIKLAESTEEVGLTQEVKPTFEEEFYLEILYEEDNENKNSEESKNNPPKDNKDDENKVFKELRDNPPNWLKSMGDKESQENYLKQIVILKFLQLFELEIADNFEGYLIEMQPFF